VIYRKNPKPSFIPVNIKRNEFPYSLILKEDNTLDLASRCFRRTGNKDILKGLESSDIDLNPS